MSRFLIVLVAALLTTPAIAMLPETNSVATDIVTCLPRQTATVLLSVSRSPIASGTVVAR